MHIRCEAPADFAAIREILLEAFADHPFSRQTEHLIVEALRADGAMTLALVAEEGERVVGHIAFSPVWVGGGECRWLGMGPLAVAPPRQRKGIGKALIEEGLARIRGAGAEGCVLVGDPAYYVRFGFRSLPGLTMEGVPHENVMGLSFGGTAPQGDVSHHRAFHAGL